MNEWKFAGVLTIALSCAAMPAQAVIHVTSANIVTSVTYDSRGTGPGIGDPPAGTSTFNPALPGDSFSTFNGASGFTSSIDPATGGFFRVAATNSNTYNLGNEHAYVAGTSGTVYFVTDMPFTLSVGSPPHPADMAFSFSSLIITNTTTGGRYVLTASYKPDDTLPAIKPPGEYRIDIDGTGHTSTGVGRLGELQIDIATTPEPTAFTALALPALLMRRRRTSHTI